MAGDVLMMLKDGGAFVLVVGSVFMLAGVLAGGLGVVAGVRWKAPAAAFLLMPILPLLAGLFGTWVGLRQAEQAILMAPFDMVQTLAAGGTSIALITTFFGAFCGVLIAIIAAWAAGLAAPLSVIGLQGRTTLVPALVGGVGTGLLAVLSPFVLLILLPSAGPTVILGPTVLFLCAIPIALVSLRLPLTGDALDLDDAADADAVRTRHEQQRLRVVGLRGTVLMATLFSLLLAGIMVWALGNIEASRAVATAPPEMKQTLIAGGRAIAMQGGLALVGLAVLQAVISAVVYALGGAATLHRRNLMWTGAAIVPVAALGLAALGLGSSLGYLNMKDRLILPDVDAAAARIGGLPALSSPVPSQAIVPAGDPPALLVYEGGTWTTEEGSIKGAPPNPYRDPAAPGSLVHGAHVVAPASMPATDLVTLPTNESWDVQLLLRIQHPGDEFLPRDVPAGIELTVAQDAKPSRTTQGIFWLADGRFVRLDPATRTYVPAREDELRHMRRGRVLVLDPRVSLGALLDHCAMERICRVAPYSTQDWVAEGGAPFDPQLLAPDE